MIGEATASAMRLAIFLNKIAFQPSMEEWWHCSGIKRYEVSSPKGKEGPRSTTCLAPNSHKLVTSKELDRKLLELEKRIENKLEAQLKRTIEIGRTLISENQLGFKEHRCWCLLDVTWAPPVFLYAIWCCWWFLMPKMQKVAENGVFWWCWESRSFIDWFFSFLPLSQTPPALVLLDTNNKQSVED